MLPLIPGRGPLSCVHQILDFAPILSFLHPKHRGKARRDRRREFRLLVGVEFDVSVERRAGVEVADAEVYPFRGIVNTLPVWS